MTASASEEILSYFGLHNVHVPNAGHVLPNITRVTIIEVGPIATRVQVRDPHFTLKIFPYSIVFVGQDGDGG